MKTHIIYIVDDSKIIAEILNKMITSLQQVTAVTFVDGESMLKQMEEKSPDMIFMDYYLSKEMDSGMNGEEIFQKIKEIDNTIPVILLTGMSDEKKLADLKNVGFSDVLHKDEFDIFTRIISLVGKHLKLPAV